MWVSTRAGEPPDVDEDLDPGGGQDLDELCQAARPVTDRENRRIAQSAPSTFRSLSP